MIHYRTFRNPDPPALVELWNKSLTGPRALPIRSTTLLEYFTLAKPYFDPAGLILALDDDRPVGFVHAGFGSTTDGKRLDPTVGVVCTLGVIPSHRRQGVGAELLRRAEAYLHGRGAPTVLVGAMAPLNPFTFALYGGSDSPGVLGSEPMARMFLEKLGYKIARTCNVYRRTFEKLPQLNDQRYTVIRQTCEVSAGAYQHASWWLECVLGPVEAVEYRLHDKASGDVLARVLLWDMGTFGSFWADPLVGLLDVEVVPDRRRKGLARFLISFVMRELRDLQDANFAGLEVQIPTDNAPAIALMTGLGFVPVEVGHCFRK